jgi:hypothetical protein
MRPALRAAVALLLLGLPAVAQAELLRVVAVAGINQVMFAAYDDNQVWVSGRPPHQLGDVNRDVPIKQMQAFGTGVAGLLILYADDQVYQAGTFSGFDLFLDAHRAGASIVDMDCQDADQVLFAYDDGQLWIWSLNTGLFRWEDLDRTIGPTPSEAATWGTVKGTFR